MKSKNGSTLVMVLIMTGVLSLIAASLLSMSGTERRTNESHFVYTQAQNAAETVVEYGFAELRHRWEQQTSFPMNSLRNDPLVLPPGTESFFADSGIIFDDIQLVGGDVPPGEWVFIDPKEPSNASDPQKGKLVFSREVEIFGKATVEAPVIGDRTAYTSQTLVIRDAPLFAHAVFYNMDMELTPGPNMDMRGPVHTNGDAYISAVERLRFHDTLNMAGDFHYGKKVHSVSDPGYVSQHGTVQVKDAAGNWQSFYKGGSKSEQGSYFTSNDEDWREASTGRWGGNVNTSEHGVPVMNTAGIDDYTPDDPLTPENEKHNAAYAMIEPLVPEGHANYKGDTIRAEQFAYKAGIVLEVESAVDPTAALGHKYTLNMYRYDRADPLEPKSTPRKVSGEPVRIDLDLAGVESRIGQSLVKVNYYNEDASGVPTGGFYDGRQEYAMDVIELDVGVLAELINDPNTIGGGSDPWDGKLRMDPSSAVDWNGIVYVEMPHDNSPSTRSDLIMPGEKQVALRLNNGQNVPDPDFAKQPGFDRGFTLATNGQLYIKGHYNSDGDPSTGSSTATDDGVSDSSSTEAPASIFADSVSILSNNFDDSKSKLDRSHRIATYNEVSAAIVTGLVPTNPHTDAQSGGVHNLPRFLERWTDGRKVEFRYRGALVALYESEVATGPWHSGFTFWYGAPERNWGFNELYGNGVLPPGTPNVRDFRRTDFRLLSESEYNSALGALSGFDFATSKFGHDTNGCSGGG